jgi:hypothetical protein
VTGSAEEAGQRTETNPAANTLAIRTTLRLNVRFAQGFELFPRPLGLLLLSQPLLFGKELSFVFAQCDGYNALFVDPDKTGAGKVAAHALRRPTKSPGCSTIWTTMTRAVRVAVLALVLGLTRAQPKKAAKTDAEIKQAIITESIASYRGSCPCPYNTDKAGRKCGARSAYSRPGGASPICYEKDVTQKMVDDYRKKTGQ